MSFVNPFFLILLLFFPAFILLRSGGLLRRGRTGTIRYSNVNRFQQVNSTWKVNGAAVMPWLIISALILMIIALARPQIGLKQTLLRREGIDIVLVLDVSTSMLAEDFRFEGRQVNRLEVVKTVARNFVNKRPNDRIGMVIFAGRPYILAPLTWDHDWSISRLNEIQAGMVDDGTAIGSAMATAINRLRESKAKSKVIILLTDGINNSGLVMPETAAQAAKALGVLTYTIGAGSRGPVPYPDTDQWGRKGYRNLQFDLDEKLLTKIANTTGGRYFRATDTHSLQTIFERINKMAKTNLGQPRYREYIDLYPYLLTLALILLVTETVLANTVFRRLP